jgi:acetyltransferase-like isoleucine patch superfamily enzyme
VSLVDSVLSRVIQRVRKNPDYRIDPTLSSSDVLREFARRGTSLLRAQWTLRFVSGSHFRFAEPGIDVRHRRHLSVGRGSVVERDARLHCLSRDGIVIGERVTIGKFAIIECTSVLWNHGTGCRIGDDSSVGDYCFLGSAGGIDIGRRVLMGQHVSMHSENHEFGNPEVPIQQQGVESEGISIGDDCWLGAGAIILDGVRLGDGCVVSAGAVVTHSFPAGSVVAGVPARVIRNRTEP